MMMAALGSTKPEAGVMATRPATPPATAPTTLGVPLCSQLTVIHVRAAMPAAVFVTTNAFAAVPLAARADPPLKPNQPDQSGDQRGDARTDVDDRSAGEIDRAEVSQPAALAPDPVGDRRVDEERPE